MSKIDSPNGEPKPGLTMRSLEEIIPLVKAQDEQNRAELGIPTKAAVENSDSRIPAFMCDPFLEGDELLSKTEHAQAIIIVAFATGAMPDRLVPAIQQRLQQGIPVFVLSNNPGDKSGILRVKYAAGSEIYEAGAVGLQKVNVNHHEEVKAAILVALEKGLSGQELAKKIGEHYAYKEGEDVPVAWDKPNYVASPRKNIRDVLRNIGIMDDEGNYIPSK